MTLRARLESVESGAVLAEAEKSAVKHPTGWEPGVVWDPSKGGTITTGPRPLDEDVDTGVWAELIADWNLDPSTIEIVPGSIQVRGWDTNVGGGLVTRMRYYRATLRPLSDASTRADLEALYKEIRKTKASNCKWTGEMTFLVCLSDFQTGNPDGPGIEGQMKALAELQHTIPARIKQLRKAGHEIGCIAIVGLGDLIEGTCGWYSSQKFRVEADLREQIKIVRRAIRDIIMAVAALAPEIKVVCVPGNHGENRDAGKAHTRVGDNHDVAIFEQVAEILSVNPEAYGHIKFRIPNDEIAVAVDLSGVQVAFTHGHTAKMRGGAADTLWGWWEKMAMGRAYPSVADSTILIAGHYHHFCTKEQQGRTVFITPSLTEVSEYFQDTMGVKTRSGTLTMLIGNGSWSELSII